MSMKDINTNDTYRIINKIKACKNNKDINQCLYEITEMIYCEYYLFAIIHPHSMVRSDISILDNYPKKWRQYYDDANLIQCDPIVDYSNSNHSPVNWSTFENDVINKKHPNVIKEAKTSGLVTGFSFPIHTANNGFGMLSFAHSSKDKYQDSLFLHACMNIPAIIPFLIDNYRKINIAHEKLNSDVTKREKECLVWACEGKSTWDISKILGCSERTVTFHLTNAQMKLNTTNRCQSISKAILTGAIDCPCFKN
ncbi:autoinducer binding domain-containing protein [Aliivibrio fischeri]|uniref:Transcriptional activator protein LuxR n=1 Tax=Aliivibrio fischeri TaxID=668 RepID=A0A510UFS9_ALIFS|nr:autoinducer binding domain-containing protein [Aliivibrio fischeri]GEK12290.1 transcriptional activator protein LuxR [Aliivibrio fischeri]